MSQLTNFIEYSGEISKDTLFIYDTKIESSANKYAFLEKSYK